MSSPSDTVDVVPRSLAVDDEIPLPPGTLLGSYRTGALLGEGGMGRVVVAEHTVIGRRVALKVLKKALASNPRAVDRFFAEAHAVNRIRHPGIVEVTDLFVDAGTPCIVMELLEGRTLADEIRIQRLSPARVVDIGIQAAQALQAAHTAGVVHRDLKPDNLFLLDTPEGVRLKVLDFGVAKLADPMPGSTSSTSAGAIVGTPEYMAPEQLAGKAIDSRVDVYSLGASLYNALSGCPPFAGDSFGDLVVKHMTIAPPPMGLLIDLPPALDQMILSMLAKNPADRPATMNDVVRGLRSAVTATPTPSPETAQTPNETVPWVGDDDIQPIAPPHRAPLLIAAGLGLVAIAVAIAVAVAPKDAPPPPVAPVIEVVEVAPVVDVVPPPLPLGPLQADPPVAVPPVDAPPPTSIGVPVSPIPGRKPPVVPPKTPPPKVTPPKVTPPKTTPTPTTPTTTPTTTTTTTTPTTTPEPPPAPTEKRGVLDPFAEEEE